MDEDAYARELERELLGGDGPEPEDLPPEKIRCKKDDDASSSSSSTEGDDDDAVAGDNKKPKKKKKAGVKKEPLVSDEEKPNKASKGRKKAATGPKKGPGRKKKDAKGRESPDEDMEKARIRAAQELLEMPLEPPPTTGETETDMEEVLRWAQSSESMVRNALLTMQSEKAPMFMARCAEVIRQMAIHFYKLMRRHQETKRAYIALVYHRQRLQQFGDRKGVVALGPVSK